MKKGRTARSTTWTTWPCRTLQDGSENRRRKYSKSLPDLTSNSGDSTTSTEERKEETQDEGYSNQKEDTSDPRVSGQTSKDRPGKEDQSTSSEDEERGGTARDRGHHLNR